MSLLPSPDTSQESTNSSKGNILAVDDTPANLHLLSNMLSKQGYKVRITTKGKLALQSVLAYPPDLILLDIMMPDMNGYEVCQILKADERTRDIPVIFISALSETFDIIKAFKVGGLDYISKPFHLEEVLARVENQLRLRSLARQLAEQNAPQS
jgi:two-component system, NtrC family, sensor kinase